MSDAVQAADEADNQELIAYIARDGQELGPFWRDDIAERARRGELLPNDYYWHEGMEQWMPLEEVLGPEAWQPPAAGPDLKRNLIVAGSIVGGLILLVLIASFLVTRREAAPVRPKSSVTDAAPYGIDPVKDGELRDKAAADLRGRIERLPDHPQPPLYTFYYDVSVNMRRSVAPRTPWEALIQGSENTIDPQSEQTTSRTEFSLTTEYRDGEWIFRHYKANTNNLLSGEQGEEEHDPNTQTPPTLVTLLGLKIVPEEAERH